MYCFITAFSNRLKTENVISENILYMNIYIGRNNTNKKNPGYCYPGFNIFSGSLNKSLCNHGICHFHKTCNISTLYIIHVSIFFPSMLYTHIMDVSHD